MNPEKSFLLGFVFGNDSLIKRSRVGDYTIKFAQKNKEWLESLSNIFVTEFGKGAEVIPIKSGYYEMRIQSKKVLQYLWKMTSSFPRNIPTKEMQRRFLQGVFDSVGSVDKTKFVITLSNNNKKLIRTTKSFLKNFGIETGKDKREKQGKFVLPIIGKENLVKFNNLIGFTNPEKKHMLLFKILAI
jgi:intein-encoded DNA endonuclease-like protein